MQLFVRPIHGATLTVSADPAKDTVADVLTKATAKCGMGCRDGLLRMEFSGRPLSLTSLIGSCGLEPGCTLHICCRMLGGKPVPVRLLTLVDGVSEVTVDIEDDTPMYEVKLQLQGLTGVPVASQKVMLQGVGQIVMGDKRSNIGFTHSGTTGSFYLGLLGAGASTSKA